MQKQGVSFYGYNDGMACTMYNCIKLFIPTVVCVVIAIIATIFAICFSLVELLCLWIMPFIMGLAYVLNISMTKYTDRVFLEGCKKKHTFIFRNGVLIKDGKEIKDQEMKLYPFKKSLFLELTKTYYRIPNDAFIGMSRAEFLSYVEYVPHSHKIRFVQTIKENEP